MNRPEKFVLETITKMQEYGFGLARKTVHLSAHNSLWAQGYRWIEQRIKDHLGDSKTYQVEHFGSTSIPEIDAKPVLDIMVIFSSKSELNEAISMFQDLGFIYKGDAVGALNKTELDTDRHFFSFYDLDESNEYIHLHVFTAHHPDVARNLKFRDTLRDKPILAEENTRIKHQLKAQSKTRHDYTTTKTTFVSKIMALIH